jgi:hypothetical protein
MANKDGHIGVQANAAFDIGEGDRFVARSIGHQTLPWQRLHPRQSHLRYVERGNSVMVSVKAE